MELKWPSLEQKANSWDLKQEYELVESGHKTTQTGCGRNEKTYYHYLCTCETYEYLTSRILDFDVEGFEKAF